MDLVGSSISDFKLNGPWKKNWFRVCGRRTVLGLGWASSHHQQCDQSSECNHKANRIVCGYVLFLFVLLGSKHVLNEQQSHTNKVR
jgi:hypothetical protein